MHDDFVPESQEAITRRRFLGLTGAAGGLAVGGFALMPHLAERSFAEAQPRKSLTSLTLAIYQNPGNLDPGGEGLVDDENILVNVFDPLIWHFPGHGRQYSPGLAESWSVSHDVTAYTFKLRRNVTFHDGTHLDAHAVKATFDHIVNPATKSKAALGALGAYKETRVLDKYTAQIVFHHPNASFLNEVCQGGLMGISSPTALKKGTTSFGRHPVGTGPFMFSRWATGESVELVRNPHYRWGPAVLGRTGPPALSRLAFRILSDPGARFNALQTNEVDLIENPNPQDAHTAIQSKQFKLFGSSITGMPYNVMVNATKPPTDDIQVRRALQFAVDQSAITKTVFFGLFSPAHQVFTPITIGYDPALNGMYKHSPAQAEKLLDQAGWKKGSDGIRRKGGKELTLNFINIAGFGFDGISQVMQSQFRQVGIVTNISDQSFPAVAATYNRGDQNLADFFYFDVDPGFANGIFGCAEIKSGYNWEHYCNAGLDRLLAQADATFSTSKRAKLYRRANRIIMESASIIPIYNLRALFLGSTAIRGLHLTPSGNTIFYAVH